MYKISLNDYIVDSSYQNSDIHVDFFLLTDDIATG